MSFSVTDAARLLKDEPYVLHANDDLYLVRYVQEQPSEKVSIVLHMNLVSLVLQGRKEIYHHSGKVTVPAGSGFFLPKGDYLMTERIAEQHNYTALTLLFSDEWLQREAAGLLPPVTTAPAACEPGMVLFDDEALLSGLTRQLSDYFSGTADRDRLQQLLPLKIRELLLVLLSAAPSSPFETQLRRIGLRQDIDLVRLMQAHYRENLSVEQYAFLAHCSLSTFKRRFEKQFGMPPRKWIRLRRLEEAYRLLNIPGKNVTEIAYSVGFESPAHFISSFREEYHVTPKHLQQQLRSLLPH